VLVLSVSLLMIGLDNTILNVALPTLQQSLSATTSQLQWTVDAYLLAFAGLLLAAGNLGDRTGRRRALQAGLVTFGAGSALAAVSGTAGQLIASRALMGAGGALIMPSTLSIITSMFTGAPRARAIALWTALAGTGIALGPVTGGWLLQRYWWGSVFLVAATAVRLPATATAPARASLQAALKTAQQLGGPDGLALQAAARQAFTGAMSRASLTGAAVAFTAALAALILLPARDTPPGPSARRT
jgi:MFS family permease